MGGSARTSEPMVHRYLIGLGSNQRHARMGGPRAVIAAALGAVERAGAKVAAMSPIIASRPLGPSARTFANAAAVVETPLEPPEMLACLQGIEAAFGRCRRGQSWRARVIDLDLVLWDGGCWGEPGLVIPHVAFRQRGFVLTPAARIAGRWRDPLTGLILRQLAARLNKPRPASKAAKV